MTKEQIKYYRMFLTVQNILDAHTSIWSGNPKFLEFKNAFDAELEAVETLDQVASQSTRGGTRDKEHVRNSLEQKLLILSGLLFAHASLSKDEALKDMLITSPTGMRRSRETELATYAEQTLAKGRELKAILSTDYGLSEAQLDETETTLDEFRPLIGTPRQRAAIINAAKRSLEEHLDSALALLRDMIDLLMLAYQHTHPQFAYAYRQARTLVD
jgi:hypothetical protein